MSEIKNNDSTGLRGINFDLEYRTGEADLVREFYEPSLKVSRRYDRAAGFFRSSIFSLVGRELVEFAKRGGKVAPRVLADVDR